MKKVLSVFGLIAIIGLTSPAFAAPPGGPGGGMHGPSGSGPGGGHRIHAGAHHRPHMSPRYHQRGVNIHAGYPRHSYWRSYRTSYWGDPWCDYRLGWCGPYYPGVGVHIPMGGASFSVRF